MHNTTRVILSGTAAALLSLGTVGSAHADPSNAKGSFPLTITCDNGVTYHAVANGNGTFAPAHDLGSTSVLIPLAFGPQTFTLYDAQGHILYQETDPATAKAAASHNRNGDVACTYIGSLATPDGSSFTVEGAVWGYVTPA